MVYFREFDLKITLIGIVKGGYKNASSLKISYQNTTNDWHL